MGGAVAIGVGIAQNLIGWTADGVADPAEVQAYLEDASIDALGELSLTADGDQTITATVIAASVAIAAGLVGIGGAGAGVSTRNRIRTLIKAFIEGTGTTGISAASIALRADDSSTITATTGSAALAGAVGGVGVSVSISVARAYNEIANEVDAYVLDAAVTATGADGISIRAVDAAEITATSTAASIAASVGIFGSVAVAGGGADAFNAIWTKTHAYTDTSEIYTGTSKLTATAISLIAEVKTTSAALSGSGGYTGAAAVGAARARNYIGWGTNTDDTGYLYTTDDNPTSIVKDDKVKIASGLEAGVIYQYLGTKALEQFKGEDENGDEQPIEGWLALVNYGDSSLWQQTNLVPMPAEVKAWMRNTEAVAAAGAVSVKATEDANITADVKAAAGAGAIGLIAVALSGAGVSIENRVNTNVQAYITGTKTDAVDIAAYVEAGGDVTVSATDTSTITATAKAVSFAAAIGIGGAGAISLSFADNVIDNHVEAYATLATITTTADTADLAITATENATITSTATASAAAFAGLFSGAVGSATSDATVVTTTRAYADPVELDIDGNVDIAAILTADASATTEGASLAVALIVYADVRTEATAVVNPLVESYLGGYADGRLVQAAGDISVRSTLAATATTLVDGSSIAGGLGYAHAAPTATAAIAWQPSEPVTTVSSSIRGGHIVSTDGDITVKAIYNQDLSVEGTMIPLGTGAEAITHAASGSFVARGASVATAVETPRLESWVAGDTTLGDGSTRSRATLSAGNTIRVISSSLTTPLAEASGKSGGFVGLGESDAYAVGSPTVDARMDGDIGSDTGPGAAGLEVRALGVDKVKATAVVVSKGLGADGDNESSSTVSPTLDAHIGANSAIYVSGNITVEAKDNPEADASTKGVAKGFVGLGGSVSWVDVNPHATAYIGVGSLIEAGSVNVSAIAKPEVLANLPDYNIEIADPVENTITTVTDHYLETGDVIEYHASSVPIGGLQSGLTNPADENSWRQYSVIYVDPDTIALGAEFTTDGKTGSVIASGDQATVTHFKVAGDNTNYAAGATATIARVGTMTIASSGAYIFTPVFGYSGSVPAITYTLSSGERGTLAIEYEATYCGVNPLNETITFPTEHNFQNDDKVIYTPADPTKVIPGLVAGAQYTVRVVDARSIQLMVLEPSSSVFTVSGVAGRAIIASNDFAKDQAVTYVAPTATTFASVEVDAALNDDSTGIDDKPEKDNIFFLQENGDPEHPKLEGRTIPFHDGDYVIYSVSSAGGATDGEAIGGLVSGRTYRVLKDFDYPSQVQLARAVSGAITFTKAFKDISQAYMTGVNWAAYGFAAGQAIRIDGAGGNNGSYTISVIDGNKLFVTGNFATAGKFLGTFVGGKTPLALTPNKEDGSVHSLVLAGQAPIGGLVNGQTYYVKNPTSASYQLASTPGGAAITLDTTGLDPSAVHLVGSLFIDLGAPVAGTIHDFRIDITSGLPMIGDHVIGTHMLTGELGVNLAEIVAPPGDTVSTAYSQGSGKGFVGDAKNESYSHANATAIAYIASGSLTATGDISVLAQSATNNRATTTNSSGGFVGIGKSNATTDQTSTTYAYIAEGTNIRSGGDVTIDAWSNHITTGTATAKAGGFAADVRAHMTSHLFYDTEAYLESGAKIAAAGHVGITSDANLDVATHSYADGRGFGGGGYAETDVDVLKDTTDDDHDDDSGDEVDPCQSLVVLYPGAVVIAGTVALRATTSNMDVHADAKGYGAGFVGVSKDWADIDIVAVNFVLLNSGSSLTGYHGVDLEATFNNVDTFAYCYAKVAGLFGALDSDAKNTTTLSSMVMTLPLAQITAGPRVNGDTASNQIDALIPGLKVAIASGALAGNVYEYVGAEQTGPFDLDLLPYEDADEWRRVEVLPSEDSEGAATMVDVLTPGMIVRIAGGALAGNLYEYTGTTELTDSDPSTPELDPFDLSVQDYSTGSWKLVPVLDHHLATNLVGDAPPYTLDRLALYVNTTNYHVSIAGDADHKKKALASGGSDTDVDSVQGRTINWFADVHISSGQSAELVINAEGEITKAVGVSVNTAANPEQTSGLIAESEIFVNDIGSNGSGQVYFNDAWAGDKIDDDDNDADTVWISGMGSTWDFSDTLGQVLITNYSDKTLKINNINVVNTTDNPWVDLNSTNISLTFAIDRTAAPTLVQILNEANSDIILNGTINNPIGSTVIHNSGGNITAARPRDVTESSTGRISLIRTAVLDIRASAGSIGLGPELDLDSPRVNVDMIYPGLLTMTFGANDVCGAGDALFLGSNPFFTGQLVRYEGPTTEGGLVNGNYYTVVRSVDGSSIQLKSGNLVVDLNPSSGAVYRLTAAQHVVGVAGGDIYLDLKAVLRDGQALVTEFTATVDSLTVGGSINLLLQDAEQETGSGNYDGVRVSARQDLLYPPPVDGYYYANFWYDEGAAQAKDLAVFGGTATLRNCIYDFRDLDPATGARTVAGLTAGGNIIIEDMDGATISGVAGLTPATIAVRALTDLQGTGYIDVNVDNWIDLTETAGDLRVGLIQSRGGVEGADVTLTANNGSILDALDDLASDVTGFNITLTALLGGIGDVMNPLEFNWSNPTVFYGSDPALGLLHATVNGGAWYEFSYHGTTGALLDGRKIHLCYVGAPGIVE
ncbi:MAG: hypothetical protein M1376_17320 [Planctomycetes bacterium]|nr:hypothetical protein [Planctomycetota bacterium]